MPSNKRTAHRSGVRAKLFITSLALMLAFGGLTGLCLESWLRSFLRQREQENLLGHARSVAETFALTSTGSKEKTQALVDRLSRTSGYHITILTPAGAVVADSSGPSGPSAEGRPDTPGDVTEAIQKGWGLSSTDDSLYAAVASDRGVVRMAAPLATVDAVIQQLNYALVGAALVGLGVAAVMSLLSAHLLTRELRILVGHARALARGERSSLPWYSTEELGRLAGSFTKLAGQLEGTMDTLAKERSRFGVVLESMSEAVLTVSQELEITLVNPACVDILSLHGDPARRRLDTLDLPDLVALAEQGRQGSASGEVQVGRRMVLARATPLATSGGAVIVMHDVTEMRRLEIIRKDFVANVSHELRTPVSIVRANAETLLEGALDDPERARHFIEALYRNADRLSRIISDLLDLSQIEAGQFHLSMRGISVQDAFDRTVESLLARADSRRISLEVLLDDDLKVLADRKALDQILRNLVENAIKYTPEGGRVRLHAYQLDQSVRMEVEDDGQGIPQEHWSRIFERFYRVDTGRSRDMGGTGLGLAIVKHLVESMSGTVGVEAGEPGGARFWLVLPRSRVDEIKAA